MTRGDFSNKYFFDTNIINFQQVTDNFLKLKENQNIVIRTNEIITHKKGKNSNFFTIAGVSKGIPITLKRFTNLLIDRFSQYHNAGEILENFDEWIDNKTTKVIKQTWRNFESYELGGERRKIRRAKKGGEIYNDKFFKGGTFMSNEFIEE